MNTPLTKAYFEQVIKKLATKQDLEGLATKDDIRRLDSKIDGVETRLDTRVNSLGSKIDGVESRLTESIRGLNHNFTQRFAAQDTVLERIDGRLVEVEVKMDAVLQEASTRKQVRDLVGQLKAGGTKLDETKIFSA